MQLVTIVYVSTQQLGFCLDLEHLFMEVLPDIEFNIPMQRAN